MELFRAWLRKYVKEDRKITGKKLASKLGIKNSVRISHYHSGRVDNGVRTFPNIPFEIRKKIVEITGVPYEEALEKGRQILNPQPKEDIENRLSKLEAALPSLSNSNKPVDMITELHRNLIDKFKNKKLALELNQLLIEIEKIDPDSLKSAYEALYLVKIKAEREAQKKRPAANDKE